MGLRAFGLFLLLISLSLSAQPLHIDISSQAAILINAENGKILFEKNKNLSLYPASITKVATALYILKKYESRLDEKIIAKREALASITSQAKQQSNYRCPAYWLDTDGTHIGIKVGEEFTLKTLLIAMMIASANDAANVMAEHLEGNIVKFIEKMNQYLKEIGCKNTTFFNPHGLHHPQHKTTAEDMSLIAQKAMQYPIFREIVALTFFICPRTNLSEERYLTQTNQLLRQGPHFYRKAIGIKTGSTSQAGKTLIAGAKNQDRNLIAVILGSSNNQVRYDDSKKMLDKAFSEKKMRHCLLSSGIQKLKVKIPGGKNSLRTYLKEPLSYDFYPSETPEVKAKILWTLPRLPIEKDQQVGDAIIIDRLGKTLSKTSVYALDSVKPTLLYQGKQFFIEYKKKIMQIIFASCSALFVIYLFSRRKRGRRKVA